METSTPDLSTLPVAERNGAFLALPQPEQRRAIARDAIEQIKLGKLIASHCYFNARSPGFDFNQADGSDKVSLQEIIEQEKTTCQVCGIGAVFAGAVRLGNEFDFFKEQVARLSYNDYDVIAPGLDHMFDKLKLFFDMKQLGAIELTYEQWGKDGGTESLNDRGMRFGAEYTDNVDRLIAILQSIADHPEGLFVP